MSRPTQDSAAPRRTYQYGTVTPYGVSFQILPVRRRFALQSYNPEVAVTTTVWALPISLATTLGIDLSFSSSGY